MYSSQKQIILVTGKGGVGKSTIAAAIAYRQAKAGQKTLLVELGEESFFKPFFELDEISYQPKEISPGLFVAIWNVEHCLREYVLHFLKIKRLYQIFFENRVMKTFINAAPAISELAILGKVTANYRNHGPPLPFDVVVVDAYATGHFLALLRAPKGLSDAVRSGPFGEQSASIMKTLLNPEITSYVIVTTPEALPVIETEELFNSLKNEFGVTPEVICNRVLDVPLSAEGAQKLAKETQATRPFLSYLAYVLKRQSEFLDRVGKAFGKVTRIHQSSTHFKGIPLVQEISEDLK